MATALLPSARKGLFSGLLRSALALPALVIPLSITLNIPLNLPGIWEGILRAVPKKKPTHSKRRMRQLAGKALPTLTNLNKCPACGRIKRLHTLCEHCVASIRQMWKDDAKEGGEKVKDD